MTTKAEDFLTQHGTELGRLSNAIDEIFSSAGATRVDFNEWLFPDRSLVIQRQADFVAATEVDSNSASHTLRHRG